MLDLMADSLEYSAVVVLCVTSWVAGRESRLLDKVLSRAAAEDAQSNHPFDPEKLTVVAETTGRSVPQPFEPAIAAENPGDAENAGVMQMLVTLAEEVAPRRGRSSRIDWRRRTSGLRPNRRPIAPRCEERDQRDAPVFQSALILKRQPNSGALPADAKDPLGPDVLARYRLYAEEYAPATAPAVSRQTFR